MSGHGDVCRGRGCESRLWFDLAAAVMYLNGLCPSAFARRHYGARAMDTVQMDPSLTPRRRISSCTVLPCKLTDNGDLRTGNRNVLWTWNNLHCHSQLQPSVKAREAYVNFRGTGSRITQLVEDGVQARTV